MVLGAFQKLMVLAAVAVASIGATELLNITANAAANNLHTISYPGASYISVKFENVDLPEGDVLIVRSPDSTDGYVYTGKGRGNLGMFASSPVRGSAAVVEYFALNSAAPASKVSYRIGGYVRGFNSALESVCGAEDQSRPAKCFSGTQYTRAQAVVRLFIGGLNLCTGWLLGSDGHLVTNHHCITTASDAAQVDVEFGAESASCSDLCETELGCKGTVEATTTTLVTNSEAIDYTLLKLPASLATKYGFLQFRASGAKVGETIYIPQHPAGWAKRISATVDGGAPATIRFTGRNVTNVCGNNQIGYLADTQGGSSGSPVLSQTDNLAVALHHCGGCDNLAVDPRDVLADLKAKGITVPNGSV